MSVGVRPFLLHIDLADPEPLPASDSLIDTFKSELKGWEPDKSVVMRTNYGPYIILHDMLLSTTQVRHNESWEAIVRKVPKPIPSIRGPIVVLCPPDVIMSWQGLAEAAGEYHELEADAAAQLAKLSIAEQQKATESESDEQQQ